jgi:replication factor C large subunit
MSKMGEPWIKKYEPKSKDEIVGQREVIEYLFKFIKFFPKVRKKAILLHGPTGTGKTCIVKAIANDLNLELFELNASDYRDANAIKMILWPAIKQVSLFGKNKLILIDEIDGVSGQQDRGGISAMIDAIKESNFPIILTANDAYSDKLKTLRTYCDLIELKQLTNLEILKKLKEIVLKENISCDLAALQALAVSANGDLRAAINDLQMLCSKDKILSREELDLWSREQKENLFTILKLIFKSYDPNVLLKTFDYIEDEVEDIMLWLDQNLPTEYNKIKDLAFAYENIANADIFLSRIKRRQHWRLFVYAKYLALVGVQQAKSETNKKIFVPQKPEILLKFFMMAAKKRKMQALAQDYAELFHTSGKRLQETFWPYYSYVCEKGKNFVTGLNL